MTVADYAFLALFLVVLSATMAGAWWLANQALDVARQGEERYRGVFSGASVGIVLVGGDGRILDCNAAWAQILERPVEEIKMSNWRDVPSAADQAGHWDIFRQVLSGRLAPRQTELTFEAPRGGTKYIDLGLSRLPLEKGEVGILCVAIDITARRMAENHLRQSELKLFRQLKLQEALIDAMPLPVFVKDAEGRYSLLNQAFSDFLGKPAEEIRGRTVYEIAPGDLARVYHQADLDLMRRGGKQIYETVVEAKDSGRRQVVFHKAVFQAPEGDPGGIIGVVLDVTERKALEESLLQAKDSAEKSVRARTEFLAVMSHEIRTPMNGLMGMVQLLEKAELLDREKNFIRVMRSSCEALLALLDDILDVTKLDTGHFVYERIDFDLPNLVDSLGQLMSARAREKGLNFAIEVPEGLGWVKGDPGRLRQILLNLIGNAIKFTDRGGVKVKLERVGEGSGKTTVRFQVIDTGIGIPDESLPGIFEPFSQAEASISRRFGGTGLGLAIVKRLVEGMGGTVGASSKPKEGSVFHFQLPFEAGLSGLVSSGTDADYPKNLSVLVVDDVEINRMVAEGLLELDGHRVSFAVSGEEAMSKIASERFDVVLLDLLMPGIDGYEVAKRIRNLPAEGAASTPILAMTASVNHADRDRAQASGMNGFLPKPLNLKDIRGQLNQVLRGLSGLPDHGVETRMTTLLDEEKLALWLGTFGDAKLRELIGTYRTSSAENFRNLSEALALKDAHQMGRIAHKIAGAAANLGFAALHRQGLAAETAAKNGDVGRALRLGGEMAEIQASSWLALEKWLARSESRP